MTQSRRASLTESLSNVAIGYFVALGVQLVAFPWYGMEVSLSDNVELGLIFTAASIARSYIVRRGFNWLTGMRP